MTVLVAGGTGFIGRAVVSALRHDGHVVRVLSRGTKANPFPHDRGITVVEGDVRDAASLADAVAGVDTVVAAVQFPGHPVEVKRKGLTYDEFDRAGTENLVSAAKKAGVTRFVYLSGAGVGEGRPEEWFVAKDRAEEAVRSSGMTWTIVRPSWVYGPRDRSLNRFALFARTMPVIPLPGSGKNRVRPVHVDDVARVVATALRSPAGENEVFPVGGPQLLTIRQIVRTMLGVMGKRRVLLPAPAPLVKLGALVLYRMPGRLLSPRAVDFVNADGDVDPRVTIEKLGVTPRALADGIDYLKT